MKRLSILFRMTGFIPALKDNPHICAAFAFRPNFMPFPALRLGIFVNSDDAAVARMRRQQNARAVSWLTRWRALAGEACRR